MSFGVINEATRVAWQAIASDVSRQRPYPGRRALVFRGRKLLGEMVTIIGHERDRYDVTAFRYGGEASQHMTAMRGRRGYVCRVRTNCGVLAWIKAEYLACDYLYKHWSIALADAVGISHGWSPRRAGG